MPVYSDYVFPRIYDLLMGMGALDSRRKRHLEGVRGEVLEVGIGTGRNLGYYPAALNSLTALDKSAGMLKQLVKCKNEVDVVLKPVLGSAECMPFADDSFDTVVSTHSLCSMEDRSAALSEIKRVLRPDGQFVFLEHGLSPELKVARWQRRLNFIQKRFAVGCQLDVAIDQEIQKAGFDFLDLGMGYNKGDSKLTGYIYEGIAC